MLPAKFVLGSCGSSSIEELAWRSVYLFILDSIEAKWRFREETTASNITQNIIYLPSSLLFYSSSPGSIVWTHTAHTQKWQKDMTTNEMRTKLPSSRLRFTTFACPARPSLMWTFWHAEFSFPPILPPPHSPPLNGVGEEKTPSS